VNGVLTAAEGREASGREGGRPSSRHSLLACCRVERSSREWLLRIWLAFAALGLYVLHQLTAGFSVTRGESKSFSFLCKLFLDKRQVIGLVT
jgi:hypothetical protein